MKQDPQLASDPFCHLSGRTPRRLRSRRNRAATSRISSKGICGDSARLVKRSKPLDAKLPARCFDFRALFVAQPPVASSIGVHPAFFGFLALVSPRPSAGNPLDSHERK
jgi:hypothetical protein